jgi:hypothetical protein
MSLNYIVQDITVNEYLASHRHKWINIKTIITMWYRDMFVSVPHFLYLFICQCACMLIPHICYYKQGCNKHGSTDDLFNILISFPLKRHSEVIGYLLIINSYCFNFLRTPQTVFHDGYANLHSLLAVFKGSLSFAYSPTLFFLSDNSHSNRCEVAAVWGFDLHF